MNVIKPVGVTSMRTLIVALLVVAGSLVMGVSGARAAFGDGFGVAPIGGSAPDNPPALADLGQDHTFWAGACDRSAAPAPPAVGDPPVAIPGGVGAIPSTTFMLANPVPAPVTPEHCIDQGGLASYPNTELRVWAADRQPGWRLPAATAAGTHPDGTTTFQFRRGPVDGGVIDGSVDNIYVDLPPGFVANPNAVAECTAEQFAARPLECPPASQVGVIRLTAESVFPYTNMFGSLHEAVYPLYNVEPRRGNAAELGFGYAILPGDFTTVRLIGKARTNGDFGITGFIGQIPAALPPVGQSLTLWGVPWAAHNDIWRVKAGHMEGPAACRNNSTGIYIPHYGLLDGCTAPYDPAWVDNSAGRAIRPFVSTETDCNPSPKVRLATDAYQTPGAFTSEGDPDLPPFPLRPQDVGQVSGWEVYTSDSPAVTGCEDLAFAPDVDFDATTANADDASGLDVELSIPQNNDPKTAGGGPLDAPAPGASQGEIDAYRQAATDFWASEQGRAVSHLKDTVVTLPDGLAVNPSAAAGLEGCDDSQIGLRQNGSPPLFNDEDPFDDQGAECPDGSVIGTVRVHTPLLDEELTGEVVLGQPRSTDPMSGDMFRLFIVVRDRERGLLAKVYGSSTSNPVTGQVVTTFANNPELPFDRLTLQITGGPTGVLRTPQRCGTHGWAARFTPWSSVGAATAVPDVPDGGGLLTAANCAFGFAPGLRAGMDRRQAGGSGKFSFELTRNDGEQWMRNLTAKLPRGLLASVRDFPLCTSAQAASGACPAASRIGSVDAAAGAGTPFVLERKGDVYLTEGYKGGPYGLLVRVPVEAGPFRGAVALDPVVVRQAIHVDRRTAEVSAISDPFPLIHHGIPLAVRRVTVTVDRANFMRNPTGCSRKEVAAQLGSAEGAAHTAAQPFYAAGCRSLPFKPRLAMRLAGRKQNTTGEHPGIRAQVRQTGIGEAGIKRAQVRLPRSLALDVNNAQALCEFEDGTKDDLEKHCPKGSIVGRARAVTPLLNNSLVGNVYFVKNVRIDPRTGNQIRTLPMIVVALRGEIAVNLRGESSVDARDRLVSTFASVPDAPITSFNLNIKGGRNGIIAVTRTRRSTINICTAGRQVAKTHWRGHNGKRRDYGVNMKTPCAKQKKAKKRKRQ
jgi:hypothetical protein